MEILLKNTEEELKSLPINSSITLIADRKIEEETLRSSISIFRLIGEQGLFNFGDSYNQSIGYIREEFSTIEYSISSKEIIPNSKYEITLKPLQPLHPNSNYGLFVDKNLDTTSISINKINSKSNSNIKVLLTSVEKIDKTIVIEVLSNPLITDKANMVTIKYQDDSYNTEYSLNLKSKNNFIVYDGVKTIFEDVPYLKGETFISTIQKSESLTNNFTKLIKTTMSGTVIQTEEDSKGLSEQDILDYYKSKDEETTSTTALASEPEWYILPDFEFKYLGFNKILVKITKEDLYVSQLDLDNLEFSTSEAFDIYTLEQYGYYDPSKEYTIRTQERNEKEFIIIVEEL